MSSFSWGEMDSQRHAPKSQDKLSLCQAESWSQDPDTPLTPQQTYTLRASFSKQGQLYWEAECPIIRNRPYFNGQVCTFQEGQSLGVSEASVFWKSYQAIWADVTVGMAEKRCGLSREGVSGRVLAPQHCSKRHLVPAPLW